jgi:hypothetical protein
MMVHLGQPLVKQTATLPRPAPSPSSGERETGLAESAGTKG